VLLATPPPDTTRYQPIATTTLTVAHGHMRPSQGGQRIRVTIPAAPGLDAYGDTIAYRWDTKVSGGARCRPGALPDLASVAAGTVIDAPLPHPPKGWCRGAYDVHLDIVGTVAACGPDDPGWCRPGDPIHEEVAQASFEVGKPPAPTCHTLGEVERCHTPATYREPAHWDVTALLDDLLGPDGATTDADKYLYPAFRHERKAVRDNWEIDDDDFYGWPPTRAAAIRMSEVLDGVLRKGRYYGRSWPGRPKAGTAARAASPGPRAGTR
jgi:hypothetical protein